MAILTPRQQQVLSAVGQGRTNKEIAADIGVTERAVKAIVSRLFEKYGVTSRAALIAQTTRSRGRMLDAADYAAFDLMPFAVVVLRGLELRFVYVNREYERISGIGREHVLGRTHADVLPDLPEASGERLRTAFRTGVPYSALAAPARWRGDDGEWRTDAFDWAVQPLFGPEGDVVGLLCLAVPTARA